MALRSTLRNLRCSKISIGRVSAEEHGGVIETREHHVSIRKGFCYEHQLSRLDAYLGGAALAHTGLSFVPSSPASSFFLL